jgi:hypothetical protein
MTEASPRPGVIEGASRVLREMLRTPKVRETARMLLTELDPGNAPLLVRTLRAEDPDLFLNLIAASPALANVGITLIAETLAQLETLPPGLAAAFAERLLADLDARRLGEAAGRASGLALRAASGGGPAASDAGNRLAEGFARAVADSGVDPRAATDRLLAAGLRAATRLLGTIHETAATGDSATREALRDLVTRVRALATPEGDHEP